MAAALDHTDSFAETQAFSAQYAVDHEDQADHHQQQQQSRLTGGGDFLGEDADDDDGVEDDDDDGDLFSPTERFRLEHHSNGATGRDDNSGKSQQQAHHLQQLQQEEEEKEEEDAAASNSLVRSASMSPQDYIPRKLVGYTYATSSSSGGGVGGSGDPSAAAWMMHRAPNPLLENQSYLRVGTNRIFEVRPPIVKFAGFQLNQVYRQQVQVINVSNASQRLHLLGPSAEKGGAGTPFKMHVRKLGRVAPGMAETLTITFEPDAFRYYQDSIRVHCLGENLLIPLHAFPVMNAQQAVFPSHIDLGRCAVGQRVSKRVELVCDVPLQFEYELQLLHPTVDFRLFPARGLVPPRGSAWVTVDFCPKRAVTATAEVRVSLAQFDFRPFVCTIVGHGFLPQLQTETEQPSASCSSSSPPSALYQHADERWLAEQRRKERARQRKKQLANTPQGAPGVLAKAGSDMMGATAQAAAGQKKMKTTGRSGLR